MDRAPRRRLGIRALLLALLLPGIAALLALDSWNDYRALKRVIVDAYDQALIEPVQALDDSLAVDGTGKLRIDAAFSVQSMFEATRPRFKHLGVRYVRVPVAPYAAGSVIADTAPAATMQALMGPNDLPVPPPGPDGVVVLYDAVYRGYPVRVASMRRTLQFSGTEALQVVSQASESTSLREQALADSWHQTLFNDARIVLLVVVAVWLGVALALRPLQRLRRSLASRAPGELEPLDPRGVPAEVVPLVEAVNHHIADHHRMLADQTRFLADASHQLRTPLAIMLTQAGYALREHDPAVMRETLHAIVAQLERAKRLSTQLLALAHAQEPASHGAGEALPAVDLNAIAREVVLQHLPLAREKTQDLGWVDARGDVDDAAAATEPVAPVAADGAELHELLANLVDNAIKYTPEGGRITVTVQAFEDRIEVHVDDTGPGIAVARREEVFERFRRGDADASNASHAAANTRGAGLGLAIASAYARRNGGRIALDDAPADAESRGGLRATLRMPRMGTARNVGSGVS